MTSKLNVDNHFLQLSSERGIILIVFCFWLGYLTDYILGESLVKRIMPMWNKNGCPFILIIYLPWFGVVK